MEERRPGDQAILEMREEAVCDVVSQGEGDAHPEIFLHSLTRSINTKTMRVLGKIGGQQEVILIDLGSTHNFLDRSIVKRAQLKAKKEDDIRVILANMVLLTIEGKSEELKIQIQGNTF